ncbi:hypothetical protein [Actinomadura yumaensis]|uniref:Uncharacterized protein n=1 Tax=Actinomadura yumaensis TaxID=111807 RepID=A0ABW2CNQ6_9ACTN
MPRSAPPIKVPTGTDPAKISGMCASGRHQRCDGVVYNVSTSAQTVYIVCECPVPDCGHKPGELERRGTAVG